MAETVGIIRDIPVPGKGLPVPVEPVEATAIGAYPQCPLRVFVYGANSIVAQTGSVAGTVPVTDKCFFLGIEFIESAAMCAYS